jgi:hypothetical protein
MLVVLLQLVQSSIAHGDLARLKPPLGLLEMVIVGKEGEELINDWVLDHAFFLKQLDQDIKQSALFLFADAHR